MGKPPEETGLADGHARKQLAVGLVLSADSLHRSRCRLCRAGHSFVERTIYRGREENPDDLRPDMLFDVLDAVTVRRTRHFVRRYYPNDRIRGPRGVEMPVQFPEPHVEALNYDLDDVLLGFFEKLKEALAPDDEKQQPLLTMARYSPSCYRRDEEIEGSQLTLVGLIRSGLIEAV